MSLSLIGNFAPVVGITLAVRNVLISRRLTSPYNSQMQGKWIAVMHWGGNSKMRVASWLGKDSCWWRLAEFEGKVPKLNFEIGNPESVFDFSLC